MATANKIEALKQKKEKIEKELALIEAREKAKKRKEETRLKVIIGAAMVAECNANPETADLVKAVLGRAVTAQRDRELLARSGWL